MSDAASPDPSATEASDAALMSRIHAGDMSAYAELYERHLAAARTLARHLIGADAAEDVVQDAFAKVLDMLRRGGGPRSGFRPYLLTAVRRTVYDRYRGERRLQSTDQIEMYDPGVPFVDPALEGLERSMIVRAFRSLPERWQTVLWHTEIEGARPAEVAPLLGLTPNGVAALAYRAREGLRQAYLQMHLPTTDPATAPLDEECRATLDKMGSYVRGGLSRRESRPVGRHLDDCERCKAIYAELAVINSALRDVIGPLFLGAATTAYVGAAKGGSGFGGVLGRWRRMPKRRQALGAGAAAALAALVGLALVLMSGSEPIQPVPRPPVHSPSPAPPQSAPDPKPPAAQPPPAVTPPVPRDTPSSRSPAPGAAPDPGAEPGADPVPTPSPSANPPAVQPPARLTVRIEALGALVRDQPGIVAISVGNDGAGLSGDLVADVALPPGVTYAGGPTGRDAALFTERHAPGDGWHCRPRAGRVRCTRAPLPPGAVTSAYLHVDVDAAAPYDTPPAATVTSDGDGAAEARAPHGVMRDGLPARFAADGNLRVVHAGNALLTCEHSRPGCRRAARREGGRRDNDRWRMRRLDRDGSNATRTSSAARVRLPRRPEVLWAGLYWSATTRAAGPVTLRLRPPGGSYRSIRAAEVSRGRLPSGPVYQAFADVTSLVRQYGGGVWWGADPPLRTGVARYAGWALVVVAASPEAPHQQAMVLDTLGARRAPTLGPGLRRRLDAPVGGLFTGARPGRVGAVTWEGDADLPGDRLLLDGRPLVPASGDRDPRNVLDGSADGAIGPGLSFGIDVDVFPAFLRRAGTVAFTTGRDACLPGVLTVAGPFPG
ncbi:sigma-70 family RNA polymerase sigma factor [Actinomadura sp. NPDC047616]|uniref:sigma-70 family RNA polymerase sigma factor n=1 Tax=Actinomadura sp. NPDC047616 TaxID=3155914 RepID=UPI0033D2C14D